MHRVRAAGNRRRSRTALVASAAILSLVVAGCGGSDDGGASADGGGSGGDLGTLRVVTVVPNSPLFIGVQAADRLGTWEGTGLTVEVINGTSPTAGQIMASGQADIGLSEGTRAAANIDQGLEATIVASCVSPWTQYMIASIESGADSVEDLKGGTFGVSGIGSAGHYSAFKMAESLGWSESDYTVTPLGGLEPLRAALESGSIDAFAWSAEAAFSLEARGEAKVLGPTGEYVGPNVFEAFSVMNNVLEERPEAVRAFFEGYYAAIERIQEDPQLAIDVMVEDWEVDPDVAQRVAEGDIPTLSTTGEVTDEELQGLAEAVTFATGKDTPDPDTLFEFWQDALAG